MDLKDKILMMSSIHEVRPLTKAERLELEEYREDVLTLIDAAFIGDDLVWFDELLWYLAEIDRILFRYSEEFRESSSSEG